MLQFVVQDDGQGSRRTFLCERLPFTIGRAPSANLSLSAPGVWDFHAEVVRDKASGKFAIQPKGEALLRVNGERSQGKVLLAGDEIQIGALTLVVSLSPVRQKKVEILERAAWVILFLIFCVQVALVWVLK